MYKRFGIQSPPTPKNWLVLYVETFSKKLTGVIKNEYYSIGWNSLKKIEYRIQKMKSGYTIF